MPFEPHILSFIEDALSEAFHYHNQLDTFLKRCGVTTATLSLARHNADLRNNRSGRYGTAPKRYVVQELLNILEHNGQPTIPSIIEALSKGTFSEASEKSLNAISELSKIHQNSQEKLNQSHNEELKKRQEEAFREQIATTRKNLLDHFVILSTQENSQQRGYELEKFLNEYFEFEKLNPRGSFRVNHEQIDGSFAWETRTYLVEAKWVKTPIGGAEFGAFQYKIAGRTVDTRGLYISINGYSPQAISGLNGKGALNFVCIDGSHLFRTLQPGGSFKKLLEVIWRHAHETGESYLPVSSEQFLKNWL
jgi:hypothetical protein